MGLKPSIVLKNKKGFLLTTLTLFIIFLFVLTYAILLSKRDVRSEQERVKSLNEFVFAMKQDLPRQLNIFTFRTLFLLEKRIIDTGSYVDNMTLRFEEAFFNGTLYDEPQSILIGASYNDIVQSLQERGELVGLNITLSNPRVRLFQPNPWNVEFELTAQMFIEDQGGLARWNSSVTSSGKVAIEKFDDPIYLVNTNSLIAHKFVKTPYEVFVSNGDASNLSDHLQNSYYVESSSAPSFLDRFEGKLSNPSTLGIESLVNLEELSAQGIGVTEKSVVDYIYFSSNNPSFCAVQESGLPSWFRIDTAHTSKYQVTCVPS
ncbi:hypothetical protein D6817_01445 [Candidatus Pacearchaeota archaeon]|nr:MAG: hypothetical protein D6817_01445 [Candidatus Pacearchaeota archaeon]